MRKLLLVGLPSFALCGFAACVGDDPESGSPVASTPEAGGEASSGGPSASSSSGSSGDDGAVAEDAGDAAQPFDVRALPGLRLWLESTKELSTDPGNGSAFGSWSDQSGAWDAGLDGAPDGGRHVALPHDVNPPTIVANGINGRPTVAFIDGNGYLHIDNHADFQFGLGDFLIVELAKVTSGNGPLWLLRPTPTAGTEESFFPGQLCVAYGLGVNNGCTTPPYTPSTQPHVFAARRKSDVFTLRVDGSVRATLDRTADPPNIQVNPYGQPYAFIGNGVTMQVSELVVIVGPTSDASLDALEGHLKAKYGIF